MAGPNSVYYFFPTDYFVPPLHSSVGDHKNPSLPPPNVTEIKNAPADNHDHVHDHDQMEVMINNRKQKRSGRLVVKANSAKSEKHLPVSKEQKQISNGIS
ncbi:unnamed protein product [Amaranthus hypochondriacus]